MFQEIISTTYSKGVNGFFFNCNTWVNESNKWWYSYEDVIECLEIPQQKADKMIRYEIPEGEQCTCYDSNNYDIHGAQHTIPRQFISSEIVRQLIKRNNERNNSFIKFMNNIEYDTSLAKTLEKANKKALIISSNKNTDTICSNTKKPNAKQTDFITDFEVIFGPKTIKKHINKAT